MSEGPSPSLDRRRQEPLRPVLDKLVPVPTYRDRPGTPASDFSGLRPDGTAAAVQVLGTGHWTLLIFLSTGCQGCLDLWQAVGDPAGSGLAVDETVVAITHGPDHEDLPALQDLLLDASTRRGDRSAPVVMSSEAWLAYRVQGPPFFVLVDGTGNRVVTEGVAWGVDQVAEHVRAARAVA